MAIRFRCPTGHLLTVEDRFAGQTVRCGGCGKLLRVPSASRVAWKPASPPRLGQPSTAPGGTVGRPATTSKPAPVRRGAADPADGRPKIPTTPGRPSIEVVARSADRSHGRASAAWRSEWLPQRVSHVPADACRAGPEKIRKVRVLAVALAALVAISLLPLIGWADFDPATAPAWAGLLLLTGGLQGIYIAWMLNAPDWASIRVLMVVFAAVATGYAVTAAMALATPVDHPLALGLGSVRYSAAGWSGAMVALMALGTWLCGRASARWRREAWGG